jgi:hypothetical protein
MHKNATKCNETLSKWCKNKHGVSKIIDIFETYQFTCIIENHQRDTSLPDDMEQAHIKMKGQTGNEYLSISFIYHWYSFLF